MQKAFEDGAFALQVGELSGGASGRQRHVRALAVCVVVASAERGCAACARAVVESDSGVHIILRTG